jgi:flagella basal body P-ring formation protein FlgA
MVRRILCLIVFASASALAPTSAAAAPDPCVHDAIVTAVRARVGDSADVIVDSLAVFSPAGIAADARIDAAPDPAARLGGRVRFLLTVNGSRTAHAEAVIKVSVEQARAARDIARGATIGDGDVEDVRIEITSGPLHRRPRAADLAGGRALRDLAQGTVVPAQAVAVAPAVRTGQTVTAISRAFGIEAAATMVAAQSGNPGSVIRVVNRATRKALRARVVSPEVVEIVHD